MTNLEITQKVIEVGQKNNESYENWVISLLSSIAVSLAYIADNMEGNKENGKQKADKDVCERT